MELFAPRYYKKFKCIAEKCDHSCCIGWVIDVDDAALERYDKSDCGYAQANRDSIVFDGAPHFRLCDGERCAHLNENGLCKIVLNAGEAYLCDICREHPRFYNYAAVAEVGLGMSCREAARIILSSPDYDIIEAVGEVDADVCASELDSRAERSEIYTILKDKTLDYRTRLNLICEKYDIGLYDDGQMISIIDSLEYLDASHKEMFKSYESVNRIDDRCEYLERALAYFIYRHCTEAYDMDDFCARLSFCLFCERLLASLIRSQKAETVGEIAVLASIISEEIEYSEENTETLIDIFR